MKTTSLLVLLNAITHFSSVIVVIVGAHLITHGHSTAGGWTIFGGIIGLLFGGFQISRDSK